MFKKRYILTGLVLVFLAAPSLVYAQQDKTDPQRLEREKRISQRISRVQPNLSAEQKRSYKASCNGAQTKVSAHLENAKKFSENHDKKFDDFISRTNNLIEKLKTSGYDTASAQTALDSAATANEKTKTAYQNYILVMSDITAVDCRLDPEGFRASIDEAKTQFKELRKLRVEVRQAIKQDLKTALQGILKAN